MIDVNDDHQGHLLSSLSSSSLSSMGFSVHPPTKKKEELLFS